MLFVTTDEILLPDSRRIRKLHFCTTFSFLTFQLRPETCETTCFRGFEIIIREKVRLLFPSQFNILGFTS